MSMRTTIALLMIWSAASIALGQSKPLKPIPDREEIIFTPPGFSLVGKPAIAEGDATGTVNLRVVDSVTGKPIFCRVNVVGADGNYYEPAENPLTKYSLTGVWPKWPKGWGNRPGKAPFRYFGRFFYCPGEAEIRVPVGQTRVEVSTTGVVTMWRASLSSRRGRGWAVGWY